MRARYGLAAVLVLVAVAVARADSPDETAAKQRGVTVEQVQLEHAQVRLQKLETRLLDLEAKLEGTQAKLMEANAKASSAAAERDKLKEELALLTGQKTAVAERVPEADATAAEPKCTFCGIDDEATKIVYIMDYSGSMIDALDYLRKDIKKSVNTLIPVQQFGVVVFSEEATVLTEMKRATVDVKKALAVKIDTVVSQGQNDYTLVPYKDAFSKAFAMKPQVIYFLTDGTFDPRLIEDLKVLNRDKKVRINTIAYLSSAENAEFIQLYEQLKTVAKDHGGKFGKVTEKEMVGK